MNLKRPSEAILKRSLRISAGGAILGFVIAVGVWTASARSEIHDSSIDEQVSSVIFWQINNRERCDSKYFVPEACEKWARCRQGIEKTIGRAIEYPYSVAGKEELVQALPDCSFRKPLSWPDILGEKLPVLAIGALAGTFAGALVLGVASLFVMWIFEYPHAGWRRIIAIAAPWTGAATGYLHGMREESFIDGALMGLLAAICSASLILISRELYLWIKSGFEQARSDG